MKILKQKEDFKTPNGIPSGNLPAILRTSNGRLACKSGRWQILVDFCHNDRARVCSNCMSCSGFKR